MSIYSVAKQQVCVQLPTYADNVALPAFARRTPLLLQSIDVSCPPAHSSKPAAADSLLWAHAGADRRTDGRTPCRFIDSAPHTMRAVPMIYSERAKSCSFWTVLLCRHVNNGACSYVQSYTGTQVILSYR